MCSSFLKNSLQILLPSWQSSVSMCVMCSLICNSINKWPVNMIISFFLSSLTHWKQDLLMVDTPLSMKPDDIIEGRIKISRNQQWRRHLRVTLVYHHISGEQASQVRLQQSYCNQNHELSAFQQSKLCNVWV